MAFVEWSVKFETGMAKIDQQHRVLVNMINELADLEANIGKRVNDASLEQKLTELIDYTNYHFQTEEELFELGHYEKAKEHIRQHEVLRAAAQDFFKRYSQGEDVLPVLLGLLKKWLTEHILVSDMEYVPKLKTVKAAEL